MELKRTPLYELFLKEAGKIVPFAGWEMPIQFSGLINEHQAVRQHAGIFDISHMGVLQLEGHNLKDALQKLVPTDLNRIGPQEACYTVLLNEEAGVIDDLIIYELGKNNQNEQRLLIVLNAACYSTDLEWLQKHLKKEGINISDAKNDGVLLAIQGPKAQEILESQCDESLNSLPPFGHRQIKIENEDIFIARTGYTGEDGFELLLPAETGKLFWQRLIQLGVTPCGLGARDTLRLEAGMHLYGNDMNTKTTPFEAGLGWLVHLEMPSNFIGKNILEQQAKEGVKQRLIGLKLEGRAIARQGYQVFHKNKPIGTITSGTWSPSLNEAIALAYVPIEYSKIGTQLLVEIRGKQYPATVEKKAFIKELKKTSN